MRRQRAVAKSPVDRSPLPSGPWPRPNPTTPGDGLDQPVRPIPRSGVIGDFLLALGVAAATARQQRRRPVQLGLTLELPRERRNELSGVLLGPTQVVDSD